MHGPNAHGKNAVCVNELELLERYKYMDASDVVMGYDDFKKKHKDLEIDLFIVTDTNSLNRIGSNVKKLVTQSRDLLYRPPSMP